LIGTVGIVMISHVGKWGLSLHWDTLIWFSTTTAQNIVTFLSKSLWGFGFDIGFTDHLYTHDSWLYFTNHWHTQTSVLRLLQSPLAVSWQWILTQEL
jgi:hypothetical protein